ncbi:MAG: ABC transporter permease [Chloroflexi bacterium]|nr:ABC transporter permease [Chloroflexota bacterium]
MTGSASAASIPPRGAPSGDLASERRPRGVGVSVVARRLVREPITLAALIVLVLVTFAGLAADIVAPHDPYAQSLMDRNLAPLTPAARGLPHIFGTDFLGRDQLSRLIHGARVSIAVGLLSVLFSGTLGVGLGMVAGYFGGRVDNVIMRTVDIQMALPSLLLALVILYTLGASFWNVILVLSITRWMVYARVTRSLTLSLRESVFIDAVRAVGCSDTRIITRHLFPNILSPVLVLATVEVAGVILAEASLDFLGLGIQPPESSWGLMLSQGRQYITSAWWLVTFPGLAILLTTLALNLVATWLRTVTDPVQRWRWLGVRTSEN